MSIFQGMRRIFTLFVALFVVATADAQEPFNGRITNIEGKGIKARIVVKGSDKRTFSDGKGRFGLTDIEADDVLMIISRRDTMTIPVEGRKSIDIVWLKEGDSFSFRAEEFYADDNKYG